MNSNIINSLLSTKIVTIIREDSYENGLKQALYAIENKAQIIEITYTTPRAGEIINYLHKKYPQLIIGAGSVTKLSFAQDALQNDASFLVSFNFDQEILNFCLAKQILYIPGALSPSEVTNAYHKGCQIVKIFPASLLGFDYFKQINKLLPSIILFASGGINRNNLKFWKQEPIKIMGITSHQLQNNISKSNL